MQINLHKIALMDRLFAIFRKKQKKSDDLALGGLNHVSKNYLNF